LPEGESSGHIRVPWADVLAICGNRLSATAEQPERFLVDSFPDDNEWAALSERALPDLQ
jgi:hypothetical protein